MRHRVLLLLVLLLGLTGTLQAGIGFTFNNSLIASELDGDIVAAAFADIDFDGNYEAAVAGRSHILVYSLKTKGLMRSYPLGGDSVLQLLFVDVNRDKSPEIVYSVLHGGERPGFLVVSLDGASGRADTIRYPGYANGVGGCHSAEGYIATFDLNSDGMQELFVVADGGAAAPSEKGYSQSHLYYSFPDSLLWRKRTPEVTTVSYLPRSTRLPGVWLATRTCMESRDSASQKSSSGHMYLMPDGSDSTIQVSTLVPCDDQAPSYVSIQPRYAVYGTTNTYGVGTEFITQVEQRYVCGDSGDTAVTHLMELYLLYQPSLRERWWSRLVEADYEHFTFIPELREHFVAFEVGRDALTLFRLGDGTRRGLLTHIPAGRKWWATPYLDKVPRLIAVTGRELSIYRLTVTGDGPEDGANDLLPTSFSLGSPVADASRATFTVPVYIPRIGRLYAELRDSRGERVRLLADGDVQPGKVPIRVSGSRLHSGVYEVYVQYGTQTQSAKIAFFK